MTVRRGLAVAAALAVVAGLGGCSGEPGASPPPSEPASSPGSASPSATDDAPTVPPEARGRDEESAKAFVRYWFEVFSEAMNTGETATLEALSSPECGSCDAYAALIRDSYDDGGSIEADGWVVQRMRSRSTGRTTSFDARVAVGAERFLDNNGGVIDSSDPEERDLRLSVSVVDGSWQMRSIAVYQS